MRRQRVEWQLWNRKNSVTHQVHDHDPRKTVCGRRIPVHGYRFEADDGQWDCEKCREWRQTMDLRINQELRRGKAV